MGSIHAGHLGLINTAKKISQRVVVSIYVNPTQCAVGEDFENYPRNFRADQSTLSKSGGVDAIYAPPFMYGDHHATSIVPTGVALPMEGILRPQFFSGVATIVFKLFQHVQADYAVFGEKDYQQLVVLRQMVADLDLPISLVSSPTVREADGLALSSRNQYLTKKQRAIAPNLYQTLKKCSMDLVDGNDINKTLNTAAEHLLTLGFDKIDYLDLRQDQSLATSTNVTAGNRLFIAAWLGKTRLIDNLPIRNNILRA